MKNTQFLSSISKLYSKLPFLPIIFLFIIHPNLFAQEASKKRALAYKSKLEVIMTNDQKHRGVQAKERIKLQLALDQQNRAELDRLYEVYGFPTLNEIGKEGMMAIVLVLHHSENCEWNNKWVERVLDNYSEIKDHVSLMKYMFVRTYGEREGICQAYKNALFEKLRNKYSGEILRELQIY